MTRIKLNEHHLPSSHGEPSDLYRSFKEPFNLFLSRTNPAKDRQESEEWYVAMPDMENYLRDAIAISEKSIRCFTGYTGEGKTTILRYTFGFSDTPVLKGDAHELIIPVSFDAVASRGGLIPEAHFCATLQQASRLLIDGFQINYQHATFLSHIDHNRPELLRRSPAARVNASLEALYEKAVEYDRLGCELMLLKYLLSCCPVRNILLVLDDIESLPYSTQVDLVDKACGAVFCLERTKSQFSVNLIIGCRNTTRRSFAREDRLSPYPFEDDICITDSISLEALFQSRFQSAIKHIQRINAEKWTQAKEILSTIVKILSNDYGILLVDLCNRNYRDALTALAEILANRLWFQKARISNPHFEIAQHDYALNEAAVYRALALKGGKVYPAVTTCIANLIHNDIDERTDLICIYVVRYLLRKSHHSAMMSAFRGETLDVFDAFPRPVPWDYVDGAVEYMVQMRLVFTDAVNAHDRVLTLAPKANLLWRLFQHNSILLEFFRDDTFLEFSDGSTDFGEALSGAALFMEVARVISIFSALEWSHAKSVREAGLFSRYLDVFGNQFLSELLLTGLLKSVNAYFRATPPPKNLTDLLSSIGTQQALIRKQVGS